VAEIRRPRAKANRARGRIPVGVGDRLNRAIVSREFGGFRLAWFDLWPTTPTSQGLCLGVASVLPWGYFVTHHDISAAVFRGAWFASVAVGTAGGWAIGRSRKR
jgi:hypothetical protein